MSYISNIITLNLKAITPDPNVRVHRPILTASPPRRTYPPPQTQEDSDDHAHHD